jgi:hypothetical protein
LEWGPQLDFLQGLKEAGEDPQALRDRPKPIDSRLVFYKNAFDTLSNSRRWSWRSMGMGGGQLIPEPLTIAEVLSYCELFGYRDYSFRERLLTLVQSLDLAWREAWYKQNGDSSAES